MRALVVVSGLCVAGHAGAQDVPAFLKDVLRQLPGSTASPRPAVPAAAPQTPGLFSETSVDEEVRIGRHLAANLLGAAPLVRDEALQRYVNRVGRWVASQSERPELKWYFGVVETDDVNAWALPGGYIFVTKGLYRLLAAESELAGVLGHEIAHVVKKHHLALFKQGQALGVLGASVSQQLSGAGEPALRALVGSGAEALARGLDKDAEYEADRIGVVLAARAGYAPYGLPAALRKIGQRNPREGNVALLFKTHPLPQDRLGRLGDTMADTFERYGDGKQLAERLPVLR
jgi:beta-barrel assembly-enhancing protease